MFWILESLIEVLVSVRTYDCSLKNMVYIEVDLFIQTNIVYLKM